MQRHGSYLLVACSAGSQKAGRHKQDRGNSVPCEMPGHTGNNGNRS